MLDFRKYKKITPDEYWLLPGSRVVCRHNNGASRLLTEGEVYVVDKINISSDASHCKISVKGVPANFTVSRFSFSGFKEESEMKIILKQIKKEIGL